MSELQDKLGEEFAVSSEENTEFKIAAHELGVEGVETIEVERPPAEIPEKNKKLLIEEKEKIEERVKAEEERIRLYKKSIKIDLTGETRTKTEMDELIAECGIKKDRFGFSTLQKKMVNAQLAFARWKNERKSKKARYKEIRSFVETNMKAHEIEKTTKDAVEKRSQKMHDEIVKSLKPDIVDSDQDVTTDIEKNASELDMHGVETIIPPKEHLVQIPKFDLSMEAFKKQVSKLTVQPEDIELAYEQYCEFSLGHQKAHGLLPEPEVAEEIAVKFNKAKIKK